MRGMEGAKDAVVAWLQRDLPDRVLAMGVRLGDPFDPPETYATWLVPRGERFPIVEVVGMNQPTVEVVGTAEDTGNPVLVMGYRLRVYVTVRGSGFEATTRRRDRLAAVICESLAARPTLDTTWVRVDLGSLRQSFSDVRPETEQRRQGASIAAAYVEAVAMVTETIPTIENVPTADTVTATAESLA